MNTFGNNFKVSIFGESHGPVVGVTVDGVFAGIPLSEEDFYDDILRRKAGAAGTTPRIEGDVPEILSGLYQGHTTGAPLTVVFRNENTRPEDYEAFRKHPRPGHADFTANLKFGGFNVIVTAELNEIVLIILHLREPIVDKLGIFVLRKTDFR